MLYRLLICFIALAVMSMTPAHAGLWCANIELRYLGVPDWLDEAEVLNSLQSREIALGITYKEHENGIRLINVVSGSAADEAGLQTEDIITRANDIPLENGLNTGLAFANLDTSQALDVYYLRNGKRHHTSLTPKTADPLLYMLVRSLEGECGNITLGNVLPRERAEVMPALFNAQRGFRCEDAHERIITNTPKRQENVLYLVRGSQRVLITMPSWGTACFMSNALDGAELTPSAAYQALRKATGEYFDWNEANP